MARNIDTTQFNDTDVIKLLKFKQAEAPQKSNRCPKKKYSDKERILARRAQHKAYREGMKKELFELRVLKAQLESETKNSTQE